MKRIINPFIDDSVVSKNDYCSRKSIEIKMLQKLENGHNLAVIGDRRIGKTSTAHFVIDSMKGIYKIDIDLYHVIDASDIAEAIIDACKKALDKVWDSKKALDFLNNLYPQVEVAQDGYTFGFGLKKQDYKKTLSVAFEILEEVIKRTDGKLVVLFDEFQAIKEVKNGEAILKYMRGKIQKIARVPFMYLGSIRNEMDHIFRDQDSPFFKQAEIIYFNHIEPDIFYHFICERFQKKEISLKREVFNHLYSLCNGVTGDIQTFCRVAFDNLEQKNILNFKVFFIVLEIIYKNEMKYFKQILDSKELTKIQKNLLIQLAGTLDQDNIKKFGKDFQNTIGVKSPGAVTNALVALQKKGFIYKSDDQYHFSNPFFRQWILDYKFIIHVPNESLISGTRLDFGYRERLK